MNKTAIITGASSGIGRATAIALHAKGYNVVLAARRKDKLNTLAKDLNERVLVCETDVTKPSSVKAMLKDTLAAFNRVDVLINNAGLGYIGPMKDAKLSDWHTMVNVNVNGLLTCIHTCLPQLLKHQGHIINIASVAAHDVFPNTVVYCATKHAVNAITVGMRKEFRDQVKVTNISPGAVNTEFLNQSDNNDIAEGMRDYFNNNPILQSEDIAEAIIDVLSKPARVAINEVIIRPNI